MQICHWLPSGKVYRKHSDHLRSFSTADILVNHAYHLELVCKNLIPLRDPEPLTDASHLIPPAIIPTLLYRRLQVVTFDWICERAMVTSVINKGVKKAINTKTFFIVF